MSSNDQTLTIAGAPQHFPTPDWGVGRYEKFAPELEPAAQHVVKLACLRAGERVLDLGCGTGNAALLAARTGATITGIDPAGRLLEVARARLAAERLEGSFLVADAQNLPFEDRAFDAVLSVFAVIFAADAKRALAETLRVLAPGGRALISAWAPGGAVDAMIDVIISALSAAQGAEIARFRWHDLAAVRQQAAPLGASVRARDGHLVFSANSPESYLADQETHHPLVIAARAVLQSKGTYQGARARMLDALRDRNEDPRRFRATSRYRVIELRHARSAHSEQKPGWSPASKENAWPHLRPQPPLLPVSMAPRRCDTSIC